MDELAVEDLANRWAAMDCGRGVSTAARSAHKKCCGVSGTGRLAMEKWR